MIAGVGVCLRAAPSAALSRPVIRQFDVATTARLGREIYEQDRYAWVATDVMLSIKTKEELKEDGASGWIVDTAGDEPIVRFLRKRGAKLDVAYDVAFPRTGKPVLAIPGDRRLTPEQLAKARAVETALAALSQGKLPWCGGALNSVVLRDPERDGWLVYLLRSKPSRDEIPIGGHYRVSVTADGTTATQVDQLFASCLTLNKHPPGGDAAAVAALFVSHLVSPQPLETHVFLALQDHISFYVGTPDRSVWQVENGNLTRLDPATLDQAPAKPVK